MQQFAGYLIEWCPHQKRTWYLSVYVDFAPDGATIDHVYVVHDRHQVANFPYGRPEGYEYHEAAQRLVESQAASVEVSSPAAVVDDDDIVIDKEDRW